MGGLGGQSGAAAVWRFRRAQRRWRVAGFAGEAGEWPALPETALARYDLAGDTEEGRWRTKHPAQSRG